MRRRVGRVGVGIISCRYSHRHRCRCRGRIISSIGTIVGISIVSQSDVHCQIDWRGWENIGVVLKVIERQTKPQGSRRFSAYLSSATHNQ